MLSIVIKLQQSSESTNAFRLYREEKVAFNFFIKRDLRRAALLEWITPLCAALSRAIVASLTAVLAASASPLRISFSALVIRVLTELLIARFRIRRSSIIRMDFFADLECATPCTS